MHLSQKVGIVIIVLTLLFAGVILTLIGNTKESANNSKCYQQRECEQAASLLTAANFGIGLLFGLFFLGIYLMVFAHGEQALLRHLEREKKYLKAEEKLRIVHAILDENERKVFDVVREEEGITQQALRYRTSLSKAMISEILSRFEKRDIIERLPAGKTYEVYLKKAI